MSSQKIIQPMEAAVKDASTCKMSQAGEDTASPPRVLCVDDSATFRAVLVMAFTGWPNVDVVDNSIEAFSKAVSASMDEVPYDVFVLDVEMPHLDGVGLARRLRALPGGQAASLYFLTAKVVTVEFKTTAAVLNATIISKGRRTAKELRLAVESAVRACSTSKK